MTLMALSLSIGLLIDDAIVVLENTFRHMEQGESARQAASLATEEIGLAVIATSRRDRRGLRPDRFHVGGVVGRFFREFGLVATGAVFISTLVGAHARRRCCARASCVATAEARPRLSGCSNAVYGRLEAHYRRVLAWGLRHRAGDARASRSPAVVGGIAVARAVPLDVHDRRRIAASSTSG